MTDHIDRNPEAIARILGDKLPPLPDWIPDGGPVWHSTIHEYGLTCAEVACAPLLARIAELTKQLERAKSETCSNPSLDEALNSGDGVYRP